METVRLSQGREVSESRVGRIAWSRSKSQHGKSPIGRCSRLRVEGDVVAGAFLDYDADGNLTDIGVSGDMNCDGVVDNGDYHGRTFCVTQAFFPNCSAREKLSRALNGKDGPIDAERFEAFGGTTSLAFPAGKNRCVAVNVIDPRGNEVMRVERLG